MHSKFTTKILVLDDDSFMLKLIAHMLESQGCTAVTTCTDGRAALQVVDSGNGHPDLIFLDLNMPDMDGVEFVRHLVEHNYAGYLILMSGEDEPLLQASEKLVRAHNIPVLGRFHKPVTVEILAALLEKFPQANPGNEHTGNATNNAEELRAAIANGELINYYQPKVSLSSGEIVGAEVLVRWRKSQDEMVSPYKFLGLAESFGLIHDLTRVVLGNALAQSKAWLDKGLSLQLAINLSEYNIEALDFADTVATLTAAAGVAPQHVMLEVAEGWLPMNDLRAPLETLTRLHLKRFRLAIDEFGTGYFSLAQLRGIPFDELKIDRSFVHHISTDAKTKTKYDANLAIARQLNLEVSAVGVEDLGDWNLLRQTGCDYAQGRFIADPMPAEALPGWIHIWKSRILEQRLLSGQASATTSHAPI
ncbi:MAG: EAL domain-containing protein [Sideroxydans sp.]|nr:EAL domain-containing protein [Sideroxydans sp.]